MSKYNLECGMSENDCVKSNYCYPKHDIISLANECGVDTSGTRKEICKRIAKKINGQRNAPTLKSGLECGMDEKKCKTSIL